MFYRPTAILWRAVALSSVTCVTGAMAQTSEPVTTDRLDITITGERCAELPDKISVVMDDEDGNMFRFYVPRKAGCRWVGNAPETFDAELTHFSLRLPIGRTECRIPDTHQEAGVARLQFECCTEEPVKRVTINADGPVAVSYLRRVRSTQQTIIAKPRVLTDHPIVAVRELRERVVRMGLAVPCTEHAVFDRGTGTIDHVQFQKENLRLQIDYKQPKPDSTGLLLRIPAATDGMVSYEVHLDRDDVVGALKVQRAKGDASLPNLSVNAIDVDDKRLKDAGVKTLKLTVQ